MAGPCRFPQYPLALRLPIDVRRNGGEGTRKFNGLGARPGARAGEAPRQLNTSAVPQDLCPDLQDLTWPDLSDLTREAGAFALPPSSASDGLTEA